MRNQSAVRSAGRDLRKDLRAVARDTESLLKATADITEGHIQTAREQAQKAIDSARDNIDYDRIAGRVRRASRLTDGYVRDHRWGMLGTVAGVALLAGLIIARR
jgi:ElaB/YqjD/DUF883 family membrane-anchored ribosome-binding protein